MKKNILFTIISFFTIELISAQVLCVQCFNQNDSIGIGVGKNNLIINGGFENCNCGFNSNWNTFCTNSPFHNCDIPNWLCTGGGSATYPHFYDKNTEFVQEGERAPYFGNLYCKANPLNKIDTSYWNSNGCIASNLSSPFTFNDPAYGGKEGISISQTVKGLLPGITYILEFWAGGGDDFSSPVTKDGLFAVDVGFGNTFLTNKPTPLNTGVGTRFIIAFKAKTAVQTIKFTTWHTLCANCSELIIDDIRLYPPIFLPKTILICPPEKTEKAEKNESKVTVVQNKATNQITITFVEEQNNTSIKITDVKGKLVIGINVTGKQLVLDSSEMKKGDYIVKITDENKNVISRKITLE